MLAHRRERLLGQRGKPAFRLMRRRQSDADNGGFE
jgi:hypothetical protein